MENAKPTHTLGEPMFQNEHPKDRPTLLGGSAYAVEEQLVRKPYTQEELVNFKEELSQCSIDLKNKRSTAAAQMKEIRETVRIAEEAVKDRVTKIQTGFEESLQQVFLFDNQETKRMVIYDGTGEVVSERPLLPRERQTSVISLAERTGTNG